MFHIVSKFYFYTLGAFLITASHTSAEIKDWTLAFSDFSYASPHAIFLDYKIGTVLSKGCIEPVTDTTVRISSGTSEAVDEVQDLEVLLSLDKPKLVGSRIWDDRRSVEMCVRVDLLSESNVVMKRDKRDIKFDFDYRAEYDFRRC